MTDQLASEQPTSDQPTITQSEDDKEQFGPKFQQPRRFCSKLPQDAPQ